MKYTMPAAPNTVNKPPSNGVETQPPPPPGGLLKAFTAIELVNKARNRRILIFFIGLIIENNFNHINVRDEFSRTKLLINIFNALVKVSKKLKSQA